MVMLVPGQELSESRDFCLVFSMAVSLGLRRASDTKGNGLEGSLLGCICVYELSQLVFILILSVTCS